MQPLPLTLDRSSNLGDLTAPGKTRPYNKINYLQGTTGNIPALTLKAKNKRYITWKARDLKHFLFTPKLSKQIKREKKRKARRCKSVVGYPGVKLYGGARGGGMSNRLDR